MPCVILPASDQSDPRCCGGKFCSVKDCSLDYALCRAYLTALNLKFNLKSLEFWFKTYSWSGGQLNLWPKAREDEIALGEWIKAFTSAMKSNARLVSRSWALQERGKGQREMSQRWSRGESFAQDS